MVEDRFTRELADLIDETESLERDVVPSGTSRSRRSPQDPAQVYSIRIPVDRIDQLRQAAEREGTTASALIRKLVVDYLDGVPVPPPRSATDPSQAILDELREIKARLPALKDPAH
ncbi:MAG: hypothetical protein DLM62_03335 [Pseudonocardiales bacterium]|nr:MAG: hypothetical protein DLM62_03335 [Pseudonocardiales bacterium]